VKHDQSLGTVEPRPSADHSFGDSSDAARAGGSILHVAAVYAADGIRLLVAAATPAALTGRIAEHVARHASHQLRSTVARRVRALLAAGRLEDAIDLYFSRVGERWDREYLQIECVQPLPGTA